MTEEQIGEAVDEILDPELKSEEFVFIGKTIKIRALPFSIQRKSMQF